MTVIGRRNISYDRQPINLTDAHLTGVELAGANLANVDFYSANLEGAWLVGANLIGANFANAGLANANIDGANFASSLGDATLTGVEWPEDAPVPNGWRVNFVGQLESTLMPPPQEP